MRLLRKKISSSSSQKNVCVDGCCTITKLSLARRASSFIFYPSPHSLRLLVVVVFVRFCVLLRFLTRRIRRRRWRFGRRIFCVSSSAPSGTGYSSARKRGFAPVLHLSKHDLQHNAPASLPCVAGTRLVSSVVKKASLPSIDAHNPSLVNTHSFPMERIFT